MKLKDVVIADATDYKGGDSGGNNGSGGNGGGGEGGKGGGQPEKNFSNRGLHVASAVNNTKHFKYGHYKEQHDIMHNGIGIHHFSDGNHHLTVYSKHHVGSTFYKPEQTTMSGKNYIRTAHPWTDDIHEGLQKLKAEHKTKCENCNVKAGIAQVPFEKVVASARQDSTIEKVLVLAKTMKKRTSKEDKNKKHEHHTKMAEHHRIIMEHPHSGKAVKEAAKTVYMYHRDEAKKHKVDIKPTRFKHEKTGKGMGYYWAVNNMATGKKISDWMGPFDTMQDAINDSQNE